MKKKLFALLLLLCLAAGLSAPGLAAEEAPYVIDLAWLLEDDALAELESLAAEISTAQDCGVYIITLEDYREYGASVRAAAENIYQGLELGHGAGRDGELLLLSMAERDYALIAYGDFGNAAFTDHGKELLSEAFLDDFADDDWYGGFRDYLTVSEDLLKAANAGEAVDVFNSASYVYGGAARRVDGESVAIVALIALAAAGVVCFILWRQMRSVKKASRADAYLTPGGVTVRQRYDRFTHTTVSRVRVKSDNHGGRGGGTRIGGGGFSGRSGKF